MGKPYPFPALNEKERKLLRFLIQRHRETGNRLTSPVAAADYLGCPVDNARIYIRNLSVQNLLYRSDQYEPGPPVGDPKLRELAIRLWGPIVRHYFPDLTPGSRAFNYQCVQEYYTRNRHHARIHRRCYVLTWKAINAFPPVGKETDHAT